MSIAGHCILYMKVHIRHGRRLQLDYGSYIYHSEVHTESIKLATKQTLHKLLTVTQPISGYGSFNGLS